MKRFLSYALTLLLLWPVTGAAAQDSIIKPIIAPPAETGLAGTAGEISRTPHCFNVINQAPYTVLGTFVTDVYVDDKGQSARHRSNFRLETGHKSEFCTYGPFYEGGKLELVLRTLVPVFSCKTRIDADIIIHGRKKPEGGTDTWAICR